MIVKVCSVYDIKAATFAQPFFSQSIFSAQRAFQDACKDPSTMLNKHPEDFVLYLLGEFNDDTGTLIPCTHEHLGTATSFIVNSGKA